MKLRGILQGVIRSTRETEILVDDTRHVYDCARELIQTAAEIAAGPSMEARVVEFECEDGKIFRIERGEMNNASLAHKIADQLNRACALEITTTAIETIEECLGEAMHTEKNLRLTSKLAEEAELERDLEVWRQAYNAALSCYRIAICVELADKALADYRAKREENRKR